MHCTAQSKPIAEFSPTNILPQTPFWGRVKQHQGFVPKGFELTVSVDVLRSDASELERKYEDILVLLKYIDAEHCYAYIPYGPKLEPNFENQGVFLEELAESLRPKLPLNCIFIRFDLIWENQWAVEDDYFDAQGNWLGAPPNKVQEYRVNFSTQNWNLKKSIEDTLPKNTFFLNLRLPEDELLYNMRYNTRYNVRRALERDIQVKEYGRDHLHLWYALYTETALRHGMSLQPLAYFENILSKQDHTRGGVQIKLLMAAKQGQVLAAMFLVLSKKRATYLYGASKTGRGNLLATYALQWASITLAKRLGYEEYDMFGSAPNLNESHPLHGVHVYKKGFGGALYHRMGCWDYPFDHRMYNLFSVQEIQVAQQANERSRNA